MRIAEGVGEVALLSNIFTNGWVMVVVGLGGDGGMSQLDICTVL